MQPHWGHFIWHQQLVADGPVSGQSRNDHVDPSYHQSTFICIPCPTAHLSAAAGGFSFKKIKSNILKKAILGIPWRFPDCCSHLWSLSKTSIVSSWRNRWGWNGGTCAEWGRNCRKFWGLSCRRIESSWWAHRPLRGNAIKELSSYLALIFFIFC